MIILKLSFSYISDTEGQKLAAVTDGSFTYYRGVMIYTGQNEDADDQISILHPEGVITYDNRQYSYKYHLTDYMGNVRTVALADKVSAKLVEEQRTDYYPFGLAHSYNNLHKNRYLFSGKELQDQTIGRSGFLGLYDFGARYYNPMLGRWFNTDPALQTTNPYLFCGNAPMVYIDEDGRFFWLIFAVAAGAYLGGVQQSGSWNPLKWNWSSGKLWGGMALGGLSGVAGYGVGAAVTGAFAVPGTLGATFFQSGAVAGAASGAAGGATAGMINGAGQAWIDGASFGEGLLSGVLQAGTGAATGGVAGGAINGFSSLLKGNNFWTGAPINTLDCFPAPTGTDPRSYNTLSNYMG